MTAVSSAPPTARSTAPPSRPPPIRASTSGAAAKTVTIATKEKSRTYQITSETRIQKAGKPATLEDVTVGEEAAAYGHEEGGKYIAQSLRVGPRPEGEAKGKAKGKEKKE